MPASIRDLRRAFSPPQPKHIGGLMTGFGPKGWSPTDPHSTRYLQL